jgi:threonine dehydrogenase-like Zn-dependent dehydrogenase
VQGLVFKGNRQVALEEFPDPEPDATDVVVAVRASGICGSDLHPYREGSSRRVISGHEPCGVVAARGPALTDKQALLGQRVMVHHNRGCGTCKHCRVGYTQMCVQGAEVMGLGFDNHRNRVMWNGKSSFPQRFQLEGLEISRAAVVTP